MSDARKLRVPSYRHHKPSGQAVVTLDGRDFYLGPWNSTASKAEYDRLIGEWIANGRRLPESKRPREDLTINELILAYWRYAEGYYQKNGMPTSELSSIRDSSRVPTVFWCSEWARDREGINMIAPNALILMGDWSVPAARQPHDRQPGREPNGHDVRPWRCQGELRERSIRERDRSIPCQDGA